MRFGKSALIIKLIIENFINKKCLICCDNGTQRYTKLIVTGGGNIKNFTMIYPDFSNPAFLIDWSKYDVVIFDDIKEKVENVPDNITQFYLYAFPLTFVATENIVAYTYKDYVRSGNIPTLEISAQPSTTNFVTFYNNCLKEITKRATPKNNDRRTAARQ